MDKFPENNPKQPAEKIEGFSDALVQKAIDRVLALRKEKDLPFPLLATKIAEEFLRESRSDEVIRDFIRAISVGAQARREAKSQARKRAKNEADLRDAREVAAIRGDYGDDDQEPDFGAVATAREKI